MSFSIKNIKKGLNSRDCVTYVLILCIFAVIYALHHYAYFYHDDFAYAGLTYFYDVGGNFNDRFTFSNFVEFLYQHYIG